MIAFFMVCDLRQKANTMKTKLKMKSDGWLYCQAVALVYS